MTTLAAIVCPATAHCACPLCPSRSDWSKGVAWYLKSTNPCPGCASSAKSQPAERLINQPNYFLVLAACVLVLWQRLANTPGTLRGEYAWHRLTGELRRRQDTPSGL
eukprot:365679-Chlamydomonas_euryale.AAC.21